MANQLIIDGKPYSVIGGTSAYIQLSITVPVLVDGVKVNTPISYGDADIKAVAYIGDGYVAQASVQEYGSGVLLIKLSSESTRLLSKDIGNVSAILDVSATLRYDIANTSYKGGDKLAYRWLFGVEAMTHA